MSTQEHPTLKSWLREAQDRLSEGHEIIPADYGSHYGFSDTDDEENPHHGVPIKRVVAEAADLPVDLRAVLNKIRPSKFLPRGQEAAFLALAGSWSRLLGEDETRHAEQVFPGTKRVYQVDNTSEQYGYRDFCSYWVFDENGNLLGVGHWE